MNSIIEHLQKYDLIKPLGAFKPMGPISHVEIQPVKEYDGYCEPCAHGEEDLNADTRIMPRRTWTPLEHKAFRRGWSA